MAASQLSRAVEQRADKHPQLSDLRESGALEQDSDVVMFIYRDEMYNPETEYPKIAEVTIEKRASTYVIGGDMIDLDDLSRFEHIHYANEHFYSRLSIDICNTDALNGYGHIRTFTVLIEIQYEECAICGLSTLDSPLDTRYDTCKHHQWKAGLHLCVSSRGKTIEQALAKAELDLKDFANSKGQVLFERMCGNDVG